MTKITGIAYRIGAVNKNGNCIVPDMKSAKKIVKQMQEKGIQTWIEDNCILARVSISDEDYWKVQQGIMKVQMDTIIKGGGQVHECELSYD